MACNSKPGYFTKVCLIKQRNAKANEKKIYMKVQAKRVKDDKDIEGK